MSGKNKKDEFNASIAKAIKEIMAKREGNFSVTEFAKRVTYELSRMLSGEECEKFKNECGGKDIPDADLKEYYKSKGSNGISKILVRSLGKTITFPKSISYTQAHRYMNNESIVPMQVIACFCKNYQMSVDEFLERVYSEQRNSDSQVVQDVIQNTPVKAYLDHVLGSNSSYAYDTKKHEHFFKTLFKNDEKILKFHCTILNLDKSVETMNRKIGTPVIFQRGEIIFSKREKDNLCHCEADIEIAKGNRATYEGFAVILDPGTRSGVCWVALNNIKSAEISVLNFKLFDRSGNIYIAEALSTRSTDGSPIACRMILSKEAIVEKNMKKIEGYLRLNSLHIEIHERTLDSVKSYFKINSKKIDNEVLKDLEQHFESIDGSERSTIKTALRNIDANGANKIFTINYEKIAKSASSSNGSILDANPLLSAWLRKHSISPNFNIIHDEAERNLEDLYDSLEKE